jgi:type VI secretion system secreted protein Hcp
MEDRYYLTVQASKQGQLKGEVLKKSEARGIPILGYSLGVASPRQAGSGQASGKKVYEAVSVYKAAGPATPQLLQALITNEVLSKVVITTYRPAKDGKETVYFTITLTNAHISGLQHDPQEDWKPPELEEVQFVFQKIELNNLASGASAQDDWETTV